jgi:hypothetical protein
MENRGTRRAYDPVDPRRAAIWRRGRGKLLLHAGISLNLAAIALALAGVRPMWSIVMIASLVAIVAGLVAEGSVSARPSNGHRPGPSH